MKAKICFTAYLIVCMIASNILSGIFLGYFLVEFSKLLKG